MGNVYVQSISWVLSQVVATSLAFGFVLVGLATMCVDVATVPGDRVATTVGPGAGDKFALSTMLNRGRPYGVKLAHSFGGRVPLLVLNISLVGVSSNGNLTLNVELGALSGLGKGVGLGPAGPRGVPVVRFNSFLDGEQDGVATGTV